MMLLKGKKNIISLKSNTEQSNNISLYRDTSEAIYQYIYTLYCCNSTGQDSNSLITWCYEIFIIPIVYISHTQSMKDIKNQLLDLVESSDNVG